MGQSGRELKCYGNLSLLVDRAVQLKSEAISLCSENRRRRSENKSSIKNLIDDCGCFRRDEKAEPSRRLKELSRRNDLCFLIRLLLLFAPYCHCSKTMENYSIRSGFIQRRDEKVGKFTFQGNG